MPGVHRRDPHAAKRFQAASGAARGRYLWTPGYKPWAWASHYNGNATRHTHWAWVAALISATWRILNSPY